MATHFSVLATCFLFIGIRPVLVYANPLDDYIRKPDPTYSWQVEKVIEGNDSISFIIDLKSQTWRSAAEVSRPVWRHSLIITRPKEVVTDQVLLYIGGGNNEEKPEGPDPVWESVSKLTRSVVAEVRNVPNQPLAFFNDAQERVEDDLVAYSWDKVMATGDPTWSIRLPMVKSVVRAMDTIESFMASPQGGGLGVKGFVIVGASKRGWTSWLVPAVDSRVTAIVPIVIDALNIGKMLKHHYEAYGFWAPALKPYLDHNIIQRFSSPAFSELMKFEDPYFYRDRIKIPKYIVNATGDQFFLPDSSQFYFSDLVGPKYLRYLPNADHGTNGVDALWSLLTFFQATIHGTKIPEFSWVKKEDGSLVVNTSEKPESVVLWSATNSQARDFRVETIGKAFEAVFLQDEGNGTYTAQAKVPERGYSAFFIELNFKNGLQFTTEVSVVPDILPFAGQAILRDSHRLKKRDSQKALKEVRGTIQIAADQKRAEGSRND